MTLLTPEFRDGCVREWHATAGGVETVTVEDYTPSLYVAAPHQIRADLADALAGDPKVVETGTEEWYLDLRRESREPVLRVDLARVGELRTLAHEVLSERAADYAPGRVRLFDVDLAPGFRYCVDTGTEPVPGRELRRLDISIPERALAAGDLAALRVDGDPLVDGPGRRCKGDTERATDRSVLEALRDRLAAVDPDVLVCSSADLVPLCHERASELGVDCHLGREPGYERLAGESTYHSYGQVGHSPARYAVPGRAIVDRSNSFLLGKAGLAGLLDLVGRSWRPLQETARGSIGTILTSIEIREARERDVLAPWNKYEPEAFKSVATLHDADRGGFTFSPDPGIYEDVVEVDFASLYPSIMCEYNVSPETVGCDCHDRADVPGLGYSICDRRGFLADVLGPLIDDRSDFKAQRARLRADPDGDPERVATLDDRIDALKWVLVSSFGYQGYRNAKFGRIECHEAINAIAREILLDAKERLEAGGWCVVHGIVDSLWVQSGVERSEAPNGERGASTDERPASREGGPRPTGADDPEPIGQVAAAVGEDADIPLEVEDRFEWVCFAPLRDSNAGALTRYFGKVAGADSEDEGAFKLRGIEARQRSTPTFVADTQRELIRTLDRQRDPAAVCDRLARALARLDRGAIDPADLVVRQRVSRSLDDYSQRTRAVAALERVRDHGLSRAPGEDVRYVVVDDERRDAERVRLPFEDAGDYDTDYYRTLLVRATESVVSPLGWDRGRIRRHLRDGRDASLAAFE